MTQNIPVTDLTEGTLDGGGVFDAMMRSFNTHMAEEHRQRRITGPDYAQAYIGGMQSAMQQSIQFLLGAETAYQQAELLKAQQGTQLAQTQLVEEQVASEQMNNKPGGVLEQQISSLQNESAKTQAETLNLASQRESIEASTAYTEQQTTNLSTEKTGIETRNAMLLKEEAHLYGDDFNPGLNDLQRAKLTSDTAVVDQQKLNLAADLARTEATTLNLATEKLTMEEQIKNLASERDAIDAKVSLSEKQELQVVQETANAEAQLDVIRGQVLKLTADTALVEQNKLNAVTQELVLTATKCKLQAEFDLVGSQLLKVNAETAILSQKKVTEAAQTMAGGVDADSVIGRQKELYAAQSLGYKRDYEQKAAKLLLDTWNVRRTTDEATQANTTNQLDDASIGQMVAKLKAGIGVG